jgi:hypothetical protein
MLGIAANGMLIIAGGERFTWVMWQLAISSHANHSFIALACAGCDDSLPFSGPSILPHIVLPSVSWPC